MRAGGIALGVFLGLAVATQSLAATPRSTADEQAIRSLMGEMTAGFNAHDARAATAMYSVDADFVSVRGERARGREAIRATLAEIFTTRARSANVRTLEMTIRRASPNLAIVHVTNELGGLVSADGVQLPPHRELSIRVLLKSAGRWRVIAFHNTIVAPFQ